MTNPPVASGAAFAVLSVDGASQMKHEFSLDQPCEIREKWPGQLEIFSWMDLAVTVPNIITLITTRKENGRPNACLTAWNLLAGSEGGYSSLFITSEHNHTFENVMRDEEWCVCIPPVKYEEQCFRTIECNEEEADEITDAGLTVERARFVRAPRVAECPITLECRLDWHRQISAEDTFNHLMVGRVVHLAIDDAILDSDPRCRLEAAQWMYSVHSPLNPLTGRQGPSALATLVLNRIKE